MPVNDQLDNNNLLWGKKQLMWGRGGRGNAIANILDSTLQLLDGENQKDDFWNFSATTRREGVRVNDQPDNDNLR